jgi:hypothetical protein
MPPNDHALEVQPPITPWKNTLLQLAKSGAQLSCQQPIAQTCGASLFGMLRIIGAFPPATL